MTTAFVDAAELMARVRHMPDYAFAVIDHPISNATDTELRERALWTVDQAERLLLAPPRRRGTADDASGPQR